MRLTIKSLSLLMTMAMSLLVSSCKQDGPTVMYSLTLSENSVVFDMEGATRILDVLPFPETETWQAAYAGTENWFTFETSSDALTVTALPNYSSARRTGAIILTSPDDKFSPYRVEVLQEAAEPIEFSTSAADHHFDSEGGEVTFSVASNYGWTVGYDADWLTVVQEVESERMSVLCQPNETEDARSASLMLCVGEGELEQIHEIVITQGTRAENPYYNLVGKWEISAAKWYYSPNGSLNSIDYAPAPDQYYLIFDIEEGEYGKTLVMKDFLYPDTSLEIRYDKKSGNIVIPFGWTVYSYDTFLYVTLVGDRKFSYASLEVTGTPSSDYNSISLDLPSVDGFNYVGFGLWTYNDNGDKVAFGSRYMPTMFPMGPIVFKKQIL